MILNEEVNIDSLYNVANTILNSKNILVRKQIINVPKNVETKLRWDVVKNTEAEHISFAELLDELDKGTILPFNITVLLEKDTTVSIMNLSGSPYSSRNTGKPITKISLRDLINNSEIINNIAIMLDKAIEPSFYSWKNYVLKLRDKYDTKYKKDSNTLMSILKSNDTRVSTKKPISADELHAKSLETLSKPNTYKDSSIMFITRDDAVAMGRLRDSKDIDIFLLPASRTEYVSSSLMTTIKHELVHYCQIVLNELLPNLDSHSNITKRKTTLPRDFKPTSDFNLEYDDFHTFFPAEMQAFWKTAVNDMRGIFNILALYLSYNDKNVLTRYVKAYMSGKATYNLLIDTIVSKYAIDIYLSSRLLSLSSVNRTDMKVQSIINKLKNSLYSNQNVTGKTVDDINNFAKVMIKPDLINNSDTVIDAIKNSLNIK